MSLKQLFTNNAVSLLKQGILASDTTLTVLVGHGEMFPTPQTNEFFTVTLEDQSASLQEIIHVTQRDGDVFTIVRGQEGTTPKDWSATAGNDTLVDHRLTADSLTRLSNSFVNSSFPALTDFSEALNYLLQGNATSGGQEVDAQVEVVVSNLETIITTPSAYKPGTTAIYVGGTRQKRGVDFFEVGPTELRLQYVLSATSIADGQNVVVDYVVA